MADLSFIVDYKQIKAARAEIEKLGPTAVKAGRAFDTAFNKNLTTIKRQISFSQRLERQKKREADVAAKAVRAQATEEERLRMKFVQGHAAMNIYTKELNDLAAARRMEIISADEQKAAVAELNAQMAAGTGVFATTAAGMQTVGRGASRVGVLAQQAGYQFGDFAVQVQSGTNPMVAFGQQATQLIGTLSLLAKTTRGIMFFSGLGILVPVITAVAGAFMRMKDDASDSITTVQGALENLEDAFASSGEAAKSFHGIVEAFNAQQVAEGYEILADRIGNTFGPSLLDRMLYSLRGYGPDSAEVKIVTDKLAEAFGIAGENAGSVFGDGFLSNLQDAITNEDVAVIENTILSLDAFANRGPLGDKFIQDLIQIVNIMKGFTDETAEAVDKLQKAVEEGEKLRDLELDLGVKAAAAAAQLLAERLGISLAAAERMVGLATGQGVTGPDGAINQMRDKFTDGLLTDSIVFRKTYGATGSSDGGGSGTDPMAALEKFLEGKRREAELERELVGLFGQERSIRSELIKFRQEYGDVASEAQAQEFEATIRQIEADKERQRTLDEAKKQQEQLSQMISRSMENAFISMVDGTKSVKDAFREMAADIIRELYRVLVVQKMVAAVKTFFGFEDGGVFSGGSQVQAYANGGVVGGPTFFPMAGGKTGLMGEAGPEAIMPLKRGRDGKLGVHAEGSGGDTINVVQNFSFQANGDESVKKLIAQAAPQIAKMTKSSLLDDRRRGGATRAAFG